MKGIFKKVVSVLFLALCLSAQSITVLSPNGGESIDVNSQFLINWTYTGTISNVKIRYSTDGGATWTNLETSTSNDSFWIWNVNNTPTNNALVRIEDASNPVIYDQSDAVFTLNSSITVLSPNGGEVLPSGSIQYITWTSVPGIKRVKISYSQNNGATWTSLSTDFPNTGSYPWNVPNISTTAGRVLVSEFSNPTIVSDMSDNPFTIQSAIQITHPNGGETISVGSVDTIKWNYSPGISKVTISYSINGGNTWTTIVTGVPNTGMYTWNIPNKPTNQARIRVVDSDNASIMDMSDANFTFSSYITLTSPNGGENYNIWSEQNITWNSAPGITRVNIYLSTDGGASYSAVKLDYPNTGTFGWNVPNSPSNSCKIKVADNENASVFDESDSVFTISSVGISEKSRYPNVLFPTHFSEGQNRPNPFSYTTVIPLEIPVKSDVVLLIYSSSGRLVRTLFKGEKEPGFHKILWDGKDDYGNKLPHGIYFYEVKSKNYKSVRKSILLK